MIEKKRDIYIRLEMIRELVEVMKEIKFKEEELRKKFNEYDRLSIEENKLYENWNTQIEDTMHRLDHITL